MRERCVVKQFHQVVKLVNLLVCMDHGGVDGVECLCPWVDGEAELDHLRLGHWRVQ